jgi:hypothetical protein
MVAVLTALYKVKGVDDVLKWADDYNFWHYPLPSFTLDAPAYSYDESLIWALADQLGLPWSLKKHFPFSTSFAYLGFDWDLASRTVTIGKFKCVKYLA